MRRLKASCIGSLALETIRNGKGKPLGTVTNTFPNSLYWRTLTDELLFVTNRPLKSPITINIESTLSLQTLVNPQEQISANGMEISLGEDVSVDLTEAATYAPVKWSARDGLQHENIRDAVRTIALILRVIDVEGSVLDPTAMTHKAAAEFAHESVVALRGGNEHQFRREAETMLGLGGGFTPSGDDMLGGFLVSYNSLAEKLKRTQLLLNFSVIEKKTNWISGKLLDYMQRLILDEQLSATVDSASPDSHNDPVLTFEAILPRGHTSGLDIAAGAVLGLAVAQDIASGGKETEMITEKLGFISPAS